MVCMTCEQILAKHIADVGYEALGEQDVAVVKKQLLALFGALIAGYNSDGCKSCVDFVKELGGKEEATVLIWNGRVPAQYAAFANAVMGRALDICDHIAPGAHIGSAVIPAALAAAELAGGCTGRELILAVAAGTDLALRLNLAEADYDGFDPTGVAAVFASAAAAAKLLHLDEEQTLNALALAFNRCAGSFQSNIDGALAVRVIEGWTAQSGVECARLAARGITGPANFLEGVYGYFHIFGRDHVDKEQVLAGLGRQWRLNTLSFKKYPSCGQTQGSTELVLRIMDEHGISCEEIDVIKVLINPFTSKLVGKPFEIGKNPKVDAQFNVGYCVANAAVRRPVVLRHFEPEYITDESVLTFLRERVQVIVVPELHQRGHYSSDLQVILKDGRQFSASIDIPPGSPGNELQEEDFTRRFYDCVDFGALPCMAQRADRIFNTLGAFEEIDRIQDFVELFKGEL